MYKPSHIIIRSLILMSIFLLLFNNLIAQPVIQWQKNYGGTSDDLEPIVTQTTDGGYVMAGYTSSNNGDVSGFRGSIDFWVVKVSNTGAIQWQKCLGGSDSDVANSITQTTDGGYIIAGYTSSNNIDLSGNKGESDFWIVKLDNLGIIQWQKNLGGSLTEDGRSIEQTSDGGYIVAGFTRSNNVDITLNKGGADLWIVKLSSIGDIEWQKTYGGNGDEVARSINQTNDGGYIVTGRTNSTNGDITISQGQYDYWILKVSSVGNIVWQKSYGGSGSEDSYSVISTSDGGYMIAGYSNSNDGDVIGNKGGYDFWILKLNSTGNIQWQKCLGGASNDLAKQIKQTSDGGYIVAGSSSSNDNDVTGNNGGNDYWLIKLNNLGTLQWQKCLGGVGNDGASSIDKTNDGGYVVSGYSYSNTGDVGANKGGSDYWVVKLGSDPVIVPTIVSFSPASGQIGTTVTITGTNFNNTASNNTVFFGAIRANVVGVNAAGTQLTVTVPACANYQPISVTTTNNNLSAYSKEPFTITFGCAALSFVSNSFATAATSGASLDNIFSFCAGDIDGDGKPDIVAEITDSFRMVIQRNTSTFGSISFGSTLLNLNGTPSVASLGDLDGDGKLDLVVGVKTGWNKIAIFRNTSSPGTISFGPKIEILGAGSNRIQIADLDMDGKPDIILDGLTILRNTSTLGALSFAAKISLPFTIRSFSVGDIDGDTKPDITFASSSSNIVSVLRNTSSTGSISFATQVNFITSTNPYFVALGDLNGDGKPELAVANYSSNTVSVFRNTCTVGSISFSTKVDFATGSAPNYLAIGDLNGDGKPDLGISNFTSNTISVLKNNTASGSISFLAKVDFASGQSINPYSIVLADYDGDSKPDISVYNSNQIFSYNVSIFRNQLCYTPPPTVPAITSFSPGSGPVGTTVTISGTNFNLIAANNTVYFGAVKASVISVNASGTQLVVIVPAGATYQPISVTTNSYSVTAYSTKQFLVTFGCGGTAFSAGSFASKLDFSTGLNPNSISVSDIDGDGKADMLIANPGGNKISILRNTASGSTISFAARVEFSTGTGSSPQDVAVGDLNGDGKPDLAVSCYGTSRVSIFINNGTPGTISFLPKTEESTGSGPLGVFIMDIDGDGLPDIATTNTNSNTVSLIRNTSITPVVSFATKVDITTGTYPWGLLISDIDGDTKPDIAITNNASNSFSILRNTSSLGAFSFAARINFSTAAQPLRISIGDMDADGKSDLVITNSNGNSISTFRNTSTVGAISFASKFDFLTGTNPSGNSINDMDGDGKPDIVVSIAGGSIVTVFKNTSSPSILSFSSGFNYSLLTQPGANSIADFDNDGKSDIAVVNVGIDAISVFRNQINTPPPSGSISPANITICSGNSTILTASGGVTYQWMLNGNSITGATSSTYSANQSGTYSVLLYNGVCSALASNTSVVVVSPSGALTPSSANICTGTFITLSATGGTSYQWMLNGNTINGATTSSYNASVAGTYSVRIFNGTCNAMANNSSIVTVTPLPSGNIAPSTANICQGSAVNLTTSGGTSYQWELNGNDIPGANNATYSATLAGTYSVMIINGPCSVLAGNTATVNLLPLPTGTISPASANFCQGGTVVLSVSGGVSYQWIRNGINISGATSPNYSATLSGTYSVLIFNSTCNALASNTANVTVTPLPGGTINPGSANICQGSSQLLSTSGGTSYQWLLDGNNISGATSSTYSATIAGTYTVRIFSGTCSAMASNSTIVTVTPIPSGSITPANVTICQGASAALSASGGTRYQWMLNGGNISGAIAATYNATQAGTYSVTIFNSNCSAPASNVAIVNVDPPPSGNITPAAIRICQGTSTTLSTSGGTSYQWQLNGINISGATSSTYSANQSGTYTVRIIRGVCNVAANNSSVVTVTPLPSGTINPASVTICQGSLATLTATGGSTYQWLNNGTNISGATSSVYVTALDGVYSVRLYDIFGCNNLATNTSTVTVRTKPTVSFSFDKYCVGIPTTFTNTSDVSTSGAVTYQWQFGNGVTSTLQAPVYTYTQAGTYNINLTVVPTGCSQLTTSASKSITVVKPVPNVRYTTERVVENQPFQLQARDLGTGTSYLWQPATGLNDAKKINPVFNYNKQQQYLIALSTVEGCIIRDTILIQVFKKMEIFVPKGFTPNGDGKNDKLFPILAAVKDLKYFRVFNRWGQLLYETKQLGQGWDGIYKGTPQPMDTYTWTAEGTGIDGSIVKGSGGTLLIR